MSARLLPQLLLPFLSAWPGRGEVKRMPVPRTASDSMSGESPGIYGACLPSLEAAYRVGSRVVHAIVADWEHCATTPPQAAAR